MGGQLDGLGGPSANNNEIIYVMKFKGFAAHRLCCLQGYTKNATGMSASQSREVGRCEGACCCLFLYVVDSFCIGTSAQSFSYGHAKGHWSV